MRGSILRRCRFRPLTGIWLSIVIALAAVAIREHRRAVELDICNNNIEAYAAFLSRYYEAAEAKRISGQPVPPLLPVPNPGPETNKTFIDAYRQLLGLKP